MKPLSRSIASFGLAAFAAVTVAAALPSAAHATKISTSKPPKDTSNCLKILGRKANYLKCGDTIYVLPSLLKKPKAA